MPSKGQELRKWSKEEKLNIVNRHLKEHISVKQLGKIYNADFSMIARWVRQYSKQGEAAFDGKRPGNPYAAIQTSKSLTEEERLRLIIAKQEVEIARLKKGYIVKGVGASKAYVTLKELNMK